MSMTMSMSPFLSMIKVETDIGLSLITSAGYYFWDFLAIIGLKGIYNRL